MNALINTHPSTWPEAVVTVAIILAVAWVVVTLLGVVLVRRMGRR